VEELNINLWGSISPFSREKSVLNGQAVAHHNQASTSLHIFRTAKVIAWFLFEQLLYYFTKHVLSHIYWSCSLWDSYSSRERSSCYCWREKELWKLRRKH